MSSDDVVFSDLPEHQRALVATSRANIPPSPREIPLRMLEGEGSDPAHRRLAFAVVALCGVVSLVLAVLTSTSIYYLVAIAFAAGAARLHYHARFRARALAWVRDGVGAVARVTEVTPIVQDEVNRDPDQPPRWRMAYRYAIDGRESGDSQVIGAEEKALVERAGIVPIIVDVANSRTVPYFSALDVR